jgi:pimeloyl-ACP methyl ester carboxylesterase
MIDFEIETHIERPPAEVFAHVSDPDRLATWQTNTVSAIQEGDGPLGLGTRLREVHRAPGGRELASVVEVSEYEPGRTFALHVVEGTPVHLRITFEPAGRGTCMRLAAYGQLTGALRLLQPLLQRVLRRQFTRNCATLKRVLENTPSRASAAFEQAERAVFERYGIAPRARLLELAEPRLRVRVLECGEGPPLLLVPGDGAVAAAWAPLIAELPHYRTIVLDRPDFGLSDRFDYRGCDLRPHGVAMLRSLLDALELDAAPIVGSSGGAQWALWLALDAPGRVQAVVCMGAPAVCLPGFHALPAMRMLTIPGIGQLLAGMPAPNAKTTGRMLATTDARLLDHPAIVAAYHAAGRLPGYGRSVAAIFQRSMHPGGVPRRTSVITDDELARLATPALFVWGADEPFGDPEAAHRAARLMPDARVRIVPGAWHHPWLADAPGVGGAVRDFLGEPAR